MSQIDTGLQENTRVLAGQNRQVRTAHSWKLLVPRPLSFLTNALFFCGGLLFAWLEGHRGGLAAGQSAAALIAFVFAWFAIQELLVQQAKYMWNDIRDHQRDQAIPANRARVITKRPLTSGIIWLCGGRWALGLLLAALLSPSLMAVALAITVLQFIYELWAKPRARRYSVALLLIVAAGTVFKCMGAALALGWGPTDHRWWIYGMALFGTGLVYGSSLWRLEAGHFARRGLRFPRGQSAYFHKWGMAWLRLGATLGFLACILLLADGGLGFLRGFGNSLVKTPLLLLSFLAIDYGFNYRANYRQYNLLDWRDE